MKIRRSTKAKSSNSQLHAVPAMLTTNKAWRRNLLLGMGLTVGQGVWAETPALALTEETIDTMVVTGTRLDADIESMPNFVTVIDQDLIRARQDSSVIELLRDVAGVHVSQYGGRGGVSSIFVRGAEPNFTVVLIDGVKVNDPNNTRGGSFDFSTLNVAEVERVEIIRGPQSSIYGSDSLAGIISITTHRGAEQPEANLDAEVGQDGYYRTSFYGSSPIGDRSLLAGSVSRVDDGDAVPGNAFENTSASARFSSDLTEALTLDVSARFATTESEAFPEDSGGSELAVLRDVDEREQDQTTIAAKVRWQGAERLQLHFLGTYANHQEESASSGIAPGVRDGVPPLTSDAELDRINLSAYAVVDVSERVTLTGGLDYQDEEGDQVGSVEFFPGFNLATDFALDRDILGVFAEGRFESESGLSVSASIRHDDPSSSDSEFTSQVGAQYQFGNSRVFANWGEGFKLPSFFALGHALVGNPNLEPETNESWEVGVSHSSDDAKWQTTLTAFDNTFEDLIDFDFDLFTNVNRNEVKTRGAELATRVQLNERLGVSGHLSYVDIDVKDNSSKLRQRPNFRGGVAVAAKLTDSIDLQANLLHIGDSFDSSVPTGGRTLAGYERVNVRVHWNLRPGLRVWLAMDNLLDDDYQESIGFENAGFQTRVGFRYSL